LATELGYVLSKGVSGVKKDMREAAKWYRIAVSRGWSVTRDARRETHDTVG
jgi:TPR repeat protein